MQVNQPLVRFEIRFQISQVQVAVPKLQESIVQRSKDAWFLGTEVVRRNQVQGLACLRFVFVVPIRLYQPRVLTTCSAVKPKRKKFSSPASSAISIVAPSRVPMVKAAFIMNFMLLVPLAS